MGRIIEYTLVSADVAWILRPQRTKERVLR